MTIDFAILGAQKAATTSLHSGLRRHNDIYMPVGESPFFEDPDFGSRPWEQFSDPEGLNRLLGIKRPNSLCRDDLIERFAEHVPAGRFIVVLREPVSRAISAYYHLVRHAHLPILPIDLALREAVSAHRADGDPTWASIVRFGLYGRYLQRWFAHFPVDRFLLLSQSQVANDLDGALGACCTHLGLEAAPPVGRQHEISENVGLYDLRVLSAFRRGHQLKTRQVPGSVNRRAPRAFPPRAIGEAVVRVARQRADQNARPPIPSSAVQQLLAEIYTPDLALLRTLINPAVIYWDPEHTSEAYRP